MDRSRQTAQNAAAAFAVAESPKDEVRQIAAALGVHMATVYRWLSKLRSTNQVSSLLLGKRGMKPGRVLIDPVVEEVIQEEILRSYLDKLPCSSAQSNYSN